MVALLLILSVEPTLPGSGPPVEAFGVDEAVPRIDALGEGCLAPAFRGWIDLAVREGAAAPPTGDVHVAVHRLRVDLDGEDARIGDPSDTGDWAQLTEALSRSLVGRQALAGHGGAPFRSLFTLGVGPGVEPGRIQAALASAQAAGFEEVEFIAWLPEPPERAEAPDPVYAAELEASLQGIPMELRRDFLAAELARHSGVCEEMTQAAVVIPKSSAWSWCQLAWAGTFVGLPTCEAPDHGKVVTALEALIVPQHQTTTWTHALDGTLELPPGADWQDIVTAWPAP